MVQQSESSVTTGEQRYGALLRGDNVGVKNKLPMAHEGHLHCGRLHNGADLLSEREHRVRSSAGRDGS